MTYPGVKVWQIDTLPIAEDIYAAFNQRVRVKTSALISGTTVAVVRNSLTCKFTVGLYAGSVRVRLYRVDTEQLVWLLKAVHEKAELRTIDFVLNTSAQYWEYE